MIDNDFDLTAANDLRDRFRREKYFSFVPHMSVGTCFAIVTKEVLGIKIRRALARKQNGRTEKETLQEIPVTIVNGT